MSRLLLIALAALVWPMSAMALDINVALPQARTCSSLSMAADIADCRTSLCALEGHALLRCDDLILWADHIDIALGEAQSFAGAVATGHVILVEGSKVVTAERIELHEDRVQTRVDAATIEIRRPGAPVDPNGMPGGRDQAVIHGWIERLDHDHLRLRDGNLTLCDCGPGHCPSWRIDAAEIHATLGERVTLWGPQVRINLPFSHIMMPLTPPLAPLSLPLRARAWGFLPPEVDFYHGVPMVDLPLFVPLGPSYDLKITPGMRFDWGTQSYHPVALSSVGAPRLGVRWRYAPIAGTTGAVSVQLTHDGGRMMAAQARAIDIENQSPYTDEMFQRRRALVNRVAVDLKHESAVAEGLDWLLDAKWISDDLLLGDFAVAVNERFNTYWPSRSQLVWRLPSATLAVAADAMLRLDNTAPFAPNQAILPVYSNVDGAEAGTMHRGPALLLELAPVLLVGRLHGDASASYVRYGTWSRAAPHLSIHPTDPHVSTLGVLGGTVGLSYSDHMGPVSLHARSGLDGMLSNPDPGAAQVTAAWLTAAEASLRLAGRLGDYTHVIGPQLRYRGMPAQWGDAPAMDAAARARLLDARQLRRVTHQAMAVVHQSLWQGEALRPVASLDVGQPIDLRNGDVLQPWGELALSSATLGSGTAFISVDVHQWREFPVREMGLTYAIDMGSFRFNGAYERLAPDADRFERSMYELAAPRQAPLPLPQVTPTVQTNSPWAHALAAGVGYRFGGLEAGWATGVQLPRPGQAGGEPACASAQAVARGQSTVQGPHVCFTQHTFSLGYTSPCDCWGVSTVVSGVPQDFRNTLRVQVVLDVAGYQMAGKPTVR